MLSMCMPLLSMCPNVCVHNCLIVSQVYSYGRRFGVCGVILCKVNMLQSQKRVRCRTVFVFVCLWSVLEYVRAHCHTCISLWPNAKTLLGQCNAYAAHPFAHTHNTTHLESRAYDIWPASVADCHQRLFILSCTFVFLLSFAVVVVVLSLALAPDSCNMSHRKSHHLLRMCVMCLYCKSISLALPSVVWSHIGQF